MRAAPVALFAGMIGWASVQPGSAADAATYSEQVLWSFGSGTDGVAPEAGLIELNGILYGTTSAGGTGSSKNVRCSSHCGTVFSLDPTTGAENVLYSFCSQADCTDGAVPTANVVAVNGTLYGTTTIGGAYYESCGYVGGYFFPGCGTVFSLDPDTGTETELHSFPSSGADGATPMAGLIDVNGTLDGTTSAGGAYYYGTAFALDPGTGTEAVLYSFCKQENQYCLDGQEPEAGLIEAGGLYGTTSFGGTGGEGTVFVLGNAGAETVLYSFCKPKYPNCGDGALPNAGVIDVLGTLYGTTSAGGAGGGGTVFALDPNTGAEKVLHSFCPQQSFVCGVMDGNYPVAGLINVGGVLYGTTSSGGAYGGGTVFTINPESGGPEKVLYSFCSQQNCADGSVPYGLIAVNGVLYGTTSSGGAYDRGTVFALAMDR